MTKNKGLINKYIIRRVDGTPINPDNHYFVLKYEGDGDEKHINACRKALRVYAEEVRDFLPELSEELVATIRRLDTITRLEVLHKMAVEEGMFNDTTPITPEPVGTMTREEIKEKIDEYIMENAHILPDVYFTPQGEVRIPLSIQKLIDFALSLPVSVQPQGMIPVTDELQRFIDAKNEPEPQTITSTTYPIREVTDEDLNQMANKYTNGMPPGATTLAIYYAYFHGGSDVRSLLTNTDKKDKEDNQ